MKLTQASRRVEPVEQGVVIHFSQSIKQSQNYQSADITVGVSLPAANDDAAIQKAFRRAEALTEPMLTTKFRQQAKLLASLSKGA